MAKIAITVPDELAVRFAIIAQDEFSGNVTQYVRVTLLMDLLRREMISKLEFAVLKDIK